VIDVMDNEMTQIATHVLPAVDMLERSDVTGIGFLSNVAYNPQVLPAAAERRPTWWMMGQLGKRLGVDALDGFDPDTASGDDLLVRSLDGGRHSAKELLAAGPRGIRIPRHYGWVRERALSGGRWRVAPAEVVQRLPELLADTPAPGGLKLVSGRELHNHNSMPYGRYNLERFRQDDMIATISMNPRDAASRELEDGELVEIGNEDGQVCARLKVDEAIRPGAVHMVHGWLGRNATRLSPADVDPMHGQPVMSAIPVEVVRAVS